jgi:carbonic anhydrase/acetyltransferase-like protein (isoleucine patch superfamily)
MSPSIAYKDHHPQIPKNSYIAPGAYVIGQVTIGEESGVWFNTVIRGDVNWIKIGARTNIQDLSVVHVDSGGWPTQIGDDVTVGHRVIIHGCTLADRVLVGMGAIIMNGATIGEDSVIGAGSLVTENTVIPPRTLALGSPCKVKRDLSEAEIQFIKLSALHYAERASEYLQPPSVLK